MMQIANILNMIAFGILFFGLATFSPDVNMKSIPAYAKKLIAAPCNVPSKPYGKNPPAPALFSTGIVVESIFQLFGSDFIDPVIVINNIRNKFIIVNILLTIVDFLSPSANPIDKIIGIESASKSKYSAKKLVFIGVLSKNVFLNKLSVTASRYKLIARAAAADPIMYSKIRFQPIMNAINSPRIVNVYKYDEPDLGILEPNSA